ncbi:hypothetical protein NEOLEDRAFT_1129584 [Neolentinus lepideus HHB14362 ss-1]|uniref:Yeast cell wall synthesis Kre9/Knh1-like N-terminal domain-containing protein n=1 Tax=Neolentinus lepideus HHB14362 ss-1 TaxID=1314782 RepID=A0A165UIU6_9AGAM|nr:hypothetical protein NEOLEDRAFT_1129584 [Neolentinus lepideus HHB14362 ss-1]
MSRNTLFTLYHILVFTVLSTIKFVGAELYVVSPTSGSTCQAGQPCTVTWLDDGVEPLLSSIGACTIGLYTGSDELLQEIEPVNVASSLSLQFAPNAAVGPNGDGYYVRFASVSLRQTNSSTPYISYSPFFRLDGMSGSSPTQIASLISTLPVPSSISSFARNSVTSTSTIGTISLPTLSSSSLASAATIPGSRSSSGSMSTSVRPLTSPSSSSTSSPSPSPSSSAAPSLRLAPMLYVTALLSLLSLYTLC